MGGGGGGGGGYKPHNLPPLDVPLGPIVDNSACCKVGCHLLEISAQLSGQAYSIIETGLHLLRGLSLCACC